MKNARIVALIAAPLIALAVSACEVEDTAGNRDLSQSPAAKPDTGGAEKPAKDDGPKLTSDQENAVDKANGYLGMSAFSRKGLIDQLKFEGFNQKQAAFAVDYIHPDWNVQAAKKAEEYLNMTSYSRQGLLDQLKFEGFTPAQAQFGVNKSYK